MAQGMKAVRRPSAAAAGRKPKCQKPQCQKSLRKKPRWRWPVFCDICRADKQSYVKYVSNAVLYALRKTACSAALACVASVTLSLSATAEPRIESAGNPLVNHNSFAATGLASGQATVQASAQISTRINPHIDPRTAGVLEFIGALEAPGGYDAFSHYAAEAPPKPLTSMTVREVLAWQDRIDARSKSEAAGRFQIMEDTLRDYVVPTMGLTGSEIFSPKMQDAMAVVLMRRRGWDPASTDFVRMGNALAREWAALPRLSGARAGQSVYRNTQSARNRALTTPAIFLSVLENPTSHPAVLHAVQQSRRPRQNRPPRTVGAGALYISNVSRSVRSVRSVRPASPETLTGGPLSPSRIIVFRIDPYAQE